MRDLRPWLFLHTLHFVLTCVVAETSGPCARVAGRGWATVSGGSVVKNPPANAGDTGDTGSIPGSGRSPGEANGNRFQYSCWEIPWTEEPGGLQSLGFQRVIHN